MAHCFDPCVIGAYNNWFTTPFVTIGQCTKKKKRLIWANPNRTLRERFLGKLRGEVVSSLRWMDGANIWRRERGKKNKERQKERKKDMRNLARQGLDKLDMIREGIYDHRYD